MGVTTAVAPIVDVGVAEAVAVGVGEAVGVIVGVAVVVPVAVAVGVGLMVERLELRRFFASVIRPSSFPDDPGMPAGRAKADTLRGLDVARPARAGRRGGRLPVRGVPRGQRLRVTARQPCAAARPRRRPAPALPRRQPRHDRRHRPSQLPDQRPHRLSGRTAASILRFTGISNSRGLAD